MQLSASLPGLHLMVFTGTVLARRLVVTWMFCATPALLCTTSSAPLHPTVGAQADTTAHLGHALKPFLLLAPLWPAAHIVWPKATQKCWCVAHRARKIVCPWHQKIKGKHGKEEKNHSLRKCVHQQIEAAIVPAASNFWGKYFLLTKYWDFKWVWTHFVAGSPC